MNKNTTLITTLTAISMTATAAQSSTDEQPSGVRSPSAIVREAPANHWRSIDHDNTLYIELTSGRVVVELNPLLAPGHVTQLKALAREKFYDDLNFYRFVEGFVAQGGDLSEKKEIKQAKKTIKSERFHHTTRPLEITALNNSDGYAATTGFINGFAIGTNKSNNEYWQTHCNGAFAMARSSDPDSGGTEFYVVIGQAPRYLDRNLTVFGQVRQGIEHLQTLKRQPVTEPENKIFDNQIISVRVASDIDAKERTMLNIMDTNSSSFKELIKSRMNRPEAFFIERPNYVDVCGVTVPVKAT